MNNQEIWQDIEGYEGIYKVSNHGRIKSFKCGRERILKIGLNNNGYYRIGLWNECQKTYSIHRLVAIAFIPNPENKPTINHKWGDKLDNRAIALEWATHSENNSHAYRYGLNQGSAKGKFGSAHNRSKSVSQYSKDGDLIKSFGSIIEARVKTGISKISNTCNGRQKTAGGFIWKHN